MTVTPKPRALDWFALASRGLHPTKIAILETIAEGGNKPLSPADLAVAPRVVATFETDSKSPLGSTSYHVRELVGKELLELERTEPKRGALQHFYVIPAPALLSPAQQARRALARSASKMAGAEVALTDESLARAFHEAYERRAPEFGYKTREASAVPWDQVPDDNKKLMRAVCGELLAGVAGA